jgi:hypothetical protein
MTCAEYQDSLNLEANHDFMRENGIKECPRCATPIEKDGGCNHMTCAGCHAHICWNCLASFEEPGACYEHLTEVHGGNGLHEQESVSIRTCRTGLATPGQYDNGSGRFLKAIINTHNVPGEFEQSGP